MLAEPNTAAAVDARVDRAAERSNSDAGVSSHSTLDVAAGNPVAVPSGEKSSSDVHVDTHYAAQLRPSKLHGWWLSVMVNCLAGVGFICFGYDQGVMSSLLTLDSFIEVFPETQGGFGSLQSFLVSSYIIGCFLGALLNLKLGDWLGRKWTIIIGGIGMVVGTVLQAAAFNFGFMVFARIFNGIFNGMLTSTVPTYQSECAQPHRRGQLLLLSGSLITFGVAISYWIGLAFYYTTGSVQWRLPIALQGPFIVLMLVMIFIFRLPESPRWLAAKGKTSEALAVLAALEGRSVDDPKVLATFRGIIDACNQSAGDMALKELFTHGKSQHFRRTMLGVAAQCFQQISGINIITYYLTSLLADMGIGPELSRVLAGVNGTVYFLTSLIALPIIERLGRRKLMIWTCVAMGLTFVVLAGLYKINADGNKAAQVVSVLCLFLFNTWFSIGWLGMTWLYPAEVTPVRIRAPANALSTASNWLWNFFVVMVTGPMFANIGWGTYAFFAACNIIIILPSVIIFFPETKRYSLEELDLIFAIAHDQGISPVGVSRRGDLPPAGSKEAEDILGVRRFNPDMEEKLTTHGEKGQIKRFISREGSGKDKGVTSHDENAHQQV